MTVTADRLRELLDYDPLTGRFTWRVRKSQRCKAGSMAGSIGGRGYRYIEIDGRSYRAARLAVLHKTGQWPAGVVDHRNNAHDDDSWENLRDVTQAINCQNRGRGRVVSSTGLLGVQEDHGRFRAVIDKVHIGSFGAPEEASAAYLAAKRQQHPGCTI